MDQNSKALGQRNTIRTAVQQRVVGQLVTIADRPADNFSIHIEQRIKVGNRQYAIGGAYRQSDDNVAIEQRLTTDRQAGKAIFGAEAEATGAGQRRCIGGRTIVEIGFRHSIFGTFLVEPGNHDDIVFATDRDRKCRDRLATIFVGNCILERFGQRFGAVECKHIRVFIVNYVGVVAIAIQRQRAVVPACFTTDVAAVAIERHTSHGRTICALDVGRTVGAVAIRSTDSSQHIAICGLRRPDI